MTRNLNIKVQELTNGTSTGFQICDMIRKTTTAFFQLTSVSMSVVNKNISGMNNNWYKQQQMLIAELPFRYNHCI